MSRQYYLTMCNVRTFYFTNFYWNYHSWIHEATWYQIQHIWGKMWKHSCHGWRSKGISLIPACRFLFNITSRQGKKPVHLRILVGEVDFQNESGVKNVNILGLSYESISTTVCYVSIIGRWANGELERIWEEVPMAYPGICMERLRKTTNIFGEESRRVGWDLKIVSPGGGGGQYHYHHADSLRG